MDLPQNNTNRFFVRYSEGGLEHDFAIRAADTPDWGVTIRPAITAFLNALGPLLANDWRSLGATYQAKGTNFTLPTSTLPDPDPLSPSGPVTGTARAGQWRFEGRGSALQEGGPSKVSISIFGLIVNPPPSFRIDAADNVVLQAAIDVLNDSVTYPDAFFSIDGTRAIWRPYINFNYNSYWERRLRS